MKDYKLVAPDIDVLLNCFDRGFMNPSAPSKALCDAMDPLFEALSGLAPLKKNDEVKAIWITVPRGSIEDYGSYEEMLEWGDVKNREEYEQYWLEEYPDSEKWYELVLAESFKEDGSRRSRYLRAGHKTIINAHFDKIEDETGTYYGRDEAAVILCELLTEAVTESMQRLKAGTYNDFVRSSLPYQFRTGVIRRFVVWERYPGWKDDDLEGLKEEEICSLRNLLQSGINDEGRIGRLKSMTANDFLRACAIGYEACGYEGAELSLVDQYFLHADGRDEGLSGRGHGLNAGPGIDFDDPDEWKEWYFHRKQHGGHPWEVCRGGNSTHVDLAVCHDQSYLDYLFGVDQITEEEYQNRSETTGYYFRVAGKYRASEAVRFYISLSAAGLPVVLSDADEIMARYDGSGYIGIVPHAFATRYCDHLFPEKYGSIIDFIHVYEEEMDKFGDAIEWLPEEEARIIP